MFFERARALLSLSALVVATSVAAGCATETGEEDIAVSSSESELTTSQRLGKYAQIRTAARNYGVPNNAYLFAAIAYSETGVAHCWSEATWACKGPNSPECGGGPVIAGAYDGECWEQKGGLGMFQFDAGVFSDTLRKYGNEVLVMDGQLKHAVAYVVNMVKISAYTTNAETNEKALAWINRFDPNNATLRDQWIKTVTRYYNGCQPNWSCWSERIPHYNQGLTQVLNDTGGTAYWRGADPNGVTCPGGSGTVTGDIATKYKELGGCDSQLLGRPTGSELKTADGVGRYNTFERGSIYWHPKTGAHAVAGDIRAKWGQLGWEIKFLGYPVTDELVTLDPSGRYTAFQGGVIYWSPRTGAHEVHGMILDKYRDMGWEGGPLGFATSDEYVIPGGRRSDFEHGSILWDAKTLKTWVEGLP